MAKLYTIGHSNHSLEDFIQILQAYDIELLADIRTIPKSRHVPWFNLNELKYSLKKIKINYVHLPKLGGFKHPIQNSINTGWKNSAFQGYADYMQTPEFYLALKELNDLVKRFRTVIMCAEAVPWRCHRSLLSDAEIVRGVNVIEILSINSSRPHQLIDFAVVERNKKPIKIYYPSPDTK